MKLVKTLELLLAAALATVPAEAEQPAGCRTAPTAYSLDLNTKPTTLQSDVPFATDSFTGRFEYLLGGRQFKLSLQRNESFEGGTDFVHLGTSVDLPGTWSVSPGVRLIRPSSVDSAAGAERILDFGAVFRGEIRDVPVRALLVADTEDRGQNFGAIRGYLDGLPAGPVSLYGALGRKFPDIGNLAAKDTDWYLGVANDSFGLFAGDSTKPHRHGYAAFLRRPDLGIFAYGKDTAEGRWFNVQWATRNPDAGYFSPKNGSFTSEALNDMVIRPLYGDDPMTYFLLGDGLSGTVSGYRDGQKDYLHAEIGVPLGSFRAGKQVFEVYGGAGVRAGSGVPDVLTARAALVIPRPFAGLESLMLVPSVEGREAQLSIRMKHSF